MTEDDARHVEAYLQRCPICEATDRLHAKIDHKTGQGMGVRMRGLPDPEEAAEFSVHARYTLEGAMARFKRRLGLGK